VPSKLVISYLQIVHGTFNSLIFLAFVYQGWMGWNIRRRRLSGAAPEARFNRRHRRFGPVLALLAAGGYCAGLSVALLNDGTLLKWPLHLAGGTAIVALVATAFLVSRRIRGPQSPYRTWHLLAGLGIIGLYIGQILTGLVVIS
jgi:hypothetical protein